MSGLAGIAALTGSFDAVTETPQVEAMGRAQRHREPGGWRIAAQPRFIHVIGNDVGEVAATGSGLSIAFDGKITNAAGVREALRRAGTEVRAGSDRELVLSAWERWGSGCLEHLNGRFAFVVHDSRRGTSCLVRDRFGHKPFYYAMRNDRICFASEIRAILAALRRPVLNELALMEWSMYGDVLPPRTLFRGIQALPVGHLLEVGSGKPDAKSRPYYDVCKVVDPERYADYAARPTGEILDLLESTLDRVVHGHIDGQQGGVGILLSGGVDSTVVAAMAARHAELRSYNFSAWTDSELDERRVAEKIAAELGFPFQSLSIDGRTYRAELARATELYEMPLWHMQAVPIHLLARRAAADGIGILLSGVSIGPLLGAATDRYRWVLPPPILSHIPPGIMRVARKAVFAANSLPIENPFFGGNLAVGLRLLDGGSRARIVRRSAQTYEFLKKFKERRIHVMRMSDNALFLPRFFHQGDRMCMGESVEYCDAAVDADYMTLAFNLHTRFIFRRNVPKWILKELATRYVPREYAFRKKLPVWSVPVDSYFAPMFRQSFFQDGFLADYLDMDWDAVQDAYTREQEKAQVLYRLVNIEIWGRLFFLGQSVEEVTSLLQ